MFQQSPKYLVLGVLAAVALSAAPAQAQDPGARVTSSATGNMRYVGGDVDNNVRITLSGSTFTVDDTVPMTVGSGRTAVAGDVTKATCLAPKLGSSFKEFLVVSAGGNDRAVNATSTATTSGAPMDANGGAGNDTLTGDVKTNDELSGSSGNDQLLDSGSQNVLDGGTGDDTLTGGSGGDKLFGGSGNDRLDGGGSDDQLDGGAGADLIDGGPAGITVGERHDRVLYAGRTTPVHVNLARTDATQGTPANPALGIPAEGDTIRDVEDIASSDGQDVLLGNALNNTISGGGGNDAISAGAGKDLLVGGPGNDSMFPSPLPAIEFPFGVVADGQADIIECGEVGVSDGDPGDQTFRVVSDGDFVNDCATVVDQ